VLAAALCGAALVVVFPAAVRRVFDEVIPSRDLAALGRLCAWLAAAFLLREVVAAFRAWSAGVFEQRMNHELRARLHRKLLQMPLCWHKRRKTGDQLARMMDDAPAAQRAVLEGVEQGLTALLQILVCAGVMFDTSPRYALVILLPVPFIAAGGWIFSRLLAPRAARAREAGARVGSFLHETLAGIRLIKSHTAETARQHGFEDVSAAAGRGQRRLAAAWALYSPLMCLMGGLGLVLLLGTGARGVLEGEITSGELLKLILLLGFFYEPVARLHGVNQTLVSGLAGAARVFEVLDAEGAEAGRLDSPPHAARGEIRFKNVTFGYDEGMPVIHGISLHVPAGQTCAIVGVSGCGKSTLFDLLAGFYRPWSGVIEMDGVSLAGRDLAALRARTAYVMQDAFLFSGTLRANLLLARPDAGDAELWAALREARAEDFVKARPDGLDTEVGERGVLLSGGERQRLALARAFLKDAPVLLLDEATSAVDAESERHIQEALERLCESRTCMVIAHRLSTVARADVIHVMSAGRVIASGSHAELLEGCPHYRHLASLSFL
ncbi:MAG TPA: ABC transporter ATP-binding protein, partial [Prosthecobacter sp.]|nr:ABC transporter ATP-binding protein [Prosthecobacter sp.]